MSARLLAAYKGSERCPVFPFGICFIVKKQFAPETIPKGVNMKIKTTLSHQVAIIGAGPYGLATAAHLRAAKIETCVFGEPMEFWQNQMLEGMFLRSSWDACHIADPHRTSRLIATQLYRVFRCPGLFHLIDSSITAAASKRELYPMWIAGRVVSIEITGRGSRLDLNDGNGLRAGRSAQTAVTL